MKPKYRNARLFTCLLPWLRKASSGWNREIEVTGREVTQIQIDRTA